MHSPQCLPVSGAIATIVLPAPGDFKTVAAGASINSGLVIPKGWAVVISSPNADVTIEIPIPGGTSYFITVNRGVTRILLPPDLETNPVLGSSTDIWFGWIENFRALQGRQAA